MAADEIDYEALAARLTDPEAETGAHREPHGEEAAAHGRAFLLRECGSEEALKAALRPSRPAVKNVSRARKGTVTVAVQDAAFPPAINRITHTSGPRSKCPHLEETVPQSAMFHIMRNTAFDESPQLRALRLELSAVAPDASLKALGQRRDSGVDAEFEWALPGGVIRLEIVAERAPISTRDDVRRLIKRTRSDSNAGTVVSPFISPAARDELRQAGWSYQDEAGNMLLQNSDPFVYVERIGANRDPSPDPNVSTRGLRSLKGQAASIVIVRLLTEGWATSIRELARSTSVSVATASRVVDILRNDDVLKDTQDGKLVVADTFQLAERWARDYSYVRTFKARRYFSLLGDEIALHTLENDKVPYALTGVRAANAYLGEAERAAVLPPSDTWIYTTDRSAIERALDLIPDPKGTILVGECDFIDSTKEGFRSVGSQKHAWPWRVVGDLLSTSGRSAAVGEGLARVLEDERVR